MTHPLYMRDAYLGAFEANVVSVGRDRVTLDARVSYPTGGPLTRSTACKRIGLEVVDA